MENQQASDVEKRVFTLLVYCEALATGHFTNRACCSAVHLLPEPFFKIAGHSLIFDSFVRWLSKELWDQERDLDIVIAQSIEEFILANRVAQYLSAIITKIKNQTPSLLRAQLKPDALKTSQMAFRGEPLRETREVYAVFLDEQGIIHPAMDLAGKKAALAYGFLTDGSEEKVARMEIILMEAKVQSIARAAICSYDAPKIDMPCLLSVQVVKTPQDECPFCNSNKEKIIR